MTATPLVLLWGPPDEEPLEHVHRALLARGAHTVLLDQRRALSTRILRDKDGPLLRLPDGKPSSAVPLAEFSGAYPRPYPAVPEIQPDSPAYRVAHRHVARLEHELWHWMATGAATVLNRPEESASNGTKPFQTRAARRCGFTVPDSLLTNDPGAAVAFAERHGRVIYKGPAGPAPAPGCSTQATPAAWPGSAPAPSTCSAISPAATSGSTWWTRNCSPPRSSATRSTTGPGSGR